MVGTVSRWYCSNCGQPSGMMGHSYGNPVQFTCKKVEPVRCTHEGHFIRNNALGWCECGTYGCTSCYGTGVTWPDKDGLPDWNTEPTGVCQACGGSGEKVRGGELLTASVMVGR